MNKPVVITGQGTQVKMLCLADLDRLRWKVAF